MEKHQELKMEDIPVMNYGKYMIDKMRAFGDKEALVIFSNFCNDYDISYLVCKNCTRDRKCHYY